MAKPAPIGRPRSYEGLVGQMEPGRYYGARELAAHAHDQVERRPDPKHPTGFEWIRP